MGLLNDSEEAQWAWRHSVSKDPETFRAIDIRVAFLCQSGVRSEAIEMLRRCQCLTSCEGGNDPGRGRGMGKS